MPDEQLTTPPKRAPRRATKAQSAPDLPSLDQVVDLSAAEASHQRRLEQAGAPDQPKAKPRGRRKASAAAAAPAEAPAGADAPAQPKADDQPKAKQRGRRQLASAEPAETAADKPAPDPQPPTADADPPPSAPARGSRTRRKATAPASSTDSPESPKADEADPANAEAPGGRVRRGRALAPAGQPPTPVEPDPKRPPMTALLFQPPTVPPARPAKPPKSEAEPTPAPAEAAEPKPRRTAKSRPAKASQSPDDDQTASSSQTPPSQEVQAETEEREEATSRRRRRRSRTGRKADGATEALSEGVTAVTGSTRLEAKRQRRKEGRETGRRRAQITEAEFLARRESVERRMVVRERDGRTQIAVLEDGVLVEHYVARRTQHSTVGNVYLGRVQNVLPSMEAAFVDVGKGRNAVLYAGEVNWDAAGLEGQPRRIEQALASGDSVMVQVTKDPIGHKGARLTSQITLAGRYLVLVPAGGMTGISRKLPETERARLKKLLKQIVPEGSGVIVRTAAEGATDQELTADVDRLTAAWEKIQKKAASASAPSLLKGEPDLAIRVVRDIFNEDFSSMTVSGESAWGEITGYLDEVAPELRQRVTRWNETRDVFAADRIDEQLAKGLDRKVWLPSGGSLVIDRTEAMTVIDVNTGKFTGTGGTLEETVTRNNLEAAEEIVRQLRLRDIGGIIVVDFIDMVLESNRDLVLRRLIEALGRDRTRHQVAEVTSLGLVQMTRKRVGQGLVEVFSETCQACSGRGFIIHTDPVERGGSGGARNGGGK
ncbi:MAG: Rne/Rng family ribonuclease, partial [Bifidobacteriaceae bacterium]|nr:Rne/Rng family ribonuclease [Bifidobacteriaceae bacterium]